MTSKNCNNSDILNINLTSKNFNSSKCKFSKKLKIFYFNSQSLLNKLGALKNLLSSLTYDIICVTETWLNTKASDSLLLHDMPYTLVRCDRNKRQGGGCCIFIANHLPFKIISTVCIFDTNVTCIDLLDISTLNSFRIINIYIPPNFRNIINFNSFLDILAEFIEIDFPFLIIGDFNVPKIDWSHSINNNKFPTSSTEKAIIDFALIHQLKQHVAFPTRKNNILDLLFTASDTAVYDLTSNPPFGLDKHSDHISFSFSIQHDTYSENHHPTPARKNFHFANYTLINSHFQSLHWPSIFALCPSTNALGVYDPIVYLNAIYSTFMTIVHNAIDVYVPAFKNRTVVESFPRHIRRLMEYRLQLWNDRNTDKDKLINCSKRLNKEVKKFQQYKQRRYLSKISSKYKYVRLFLKSKYHKIPTLMYKGNAIFTDVSKSNALADTYQSIYNHGNFVTSDICSTKNSNILNFIEINPSDVYKELKSLSHKSNVSSDNIPEIFLKKCRDSLCFPITIILQHCVMIKAIPDIWKHAIVTPIEKVPNSSDPIHYRPISLIPACSKIFEKIIFTKISSFLSFNKIIPNSQHGFQKHKSVITQLVETFEDLSFAHENKFSVDIIYFDISKAFDSVPHNRLLEKLSSYGIRGPLLELIQNYLCNRTYSVKVGNSFSSKNSIPSGVPQGSVGGPILFIAYLADVINYCQIPEVAIKLFADDLKAYHLFKFHVQNNSPLQLFTDKFVEYCKINGLSIAPQKCNVMYIGNKNPKSKYYLLEKPINCIEDSQPIRDLGLHFTSDLKFDSHIQIITKKARRTTFALLKSIKSNDQKLFVDLFKIFVRPTLEFGTNVFNPYLLKDIQAIEKVQKCFLKSIHKKSNWQLYKENRLAPVPAYNELLAKNNLESLELRRLKSDLILFHKYLHGEAIIKCQNPFETRETKTRGEKYKLFPVSCKTIIRHNSFFVRTSRIYSLLPSTIRHTNVKSFKIKLNSHCLSKFLKYKL